MQIPVRFVTLPGMMALDLTGPAETLALAGDAFALGYIGPLACVESSIGLTLGNIQPLPETLPVGSLLVLPGVSDSRWQFDTPEAKTTLHWLMRQQPAIHRGDVRLMCVCSGAILAAKAGLLDNVACTTHHEVLARLKAAAPAAKVQENRIFVEDGNIWSSAGITSGIDLALHVIHRLCGPQQALQVAREMVVWFRRTGDDPQLSPWLQYRNHQHPAIHRAQDVLITHPEKAWSLAALAAQAHVSPRHLSRLFRQQLGISVLDYHHALRLAIAQQRIRQGESQERAALAAGFSSARQWRRVSQRTS